ncbi:MAG: carboxypeptidase-like regulatory domain-containing protein [Candidatus Bathyarchaeia archaeon]
MKPLRALSLILFIVAVAPSYIHGRPIQSLAGDSVDVTPGSFCYKLGKDLPGEDSVKLDYPKSAILTNIRGELLFNVTVTNLNQSDMFHSPGKGSYNVPAITKAVIIYIPPEFGIDGGVAAVWTSFTNDYNPYSISLSKTQSNDPVAPGWWKLSVNNLTIVGQGLEAQASKRRFEANLTQYIRIFNVTSPSIAGRYFFKAFTAVYTSSGLEVFSIGAENFPTLVVKAGLNPAYISGVVRYGGRSHPSLYGMPLDARKHPDGTVLLPEGYGGKVYARGITGDGRIVEAQAYFNATAGGRYMLYGLEEGTYNITAQAAGYLPKTLAREVSVRRGQSLEGVDIYLEEALEVSGVIRSKHGLGEAPWGYTYNYTHPGLPRPKYVRLEVTDLDENVLLESPLILADPRPLLRMEPRDKLDPEASSYPFRLRWEHLWDGHIPQDYANYTSGIGSGDYYVKVHVLGYVQVEYPVIHVTNETLRVSLEVDLQKASYFEVTAHFMEDGLNRLSPSPTWVGGFLYVEALDAAGRLAGFNISYVPAGTRSFTIQVRGLDLWNRFGSGESRRTAWLYARDRGLLPGSYRLNLLVVNMSADLIALNALLLASPEMREIYPPQTPALVAAFPPQILEQANRDTSLYLQLEEFKGSIGAFCDSSYSASVKLYRAGGLDLTFYAADWQHPPIIQTWAHPGKPITIELYNSRGDLTASIYAVQPPPLFHRVRVSTEGFMEFDGSLRIPTVAIGLKPDTYRIKVYTEGYLEDPCISSHELPVRLSMITDSRYNLIRGSTIDVTLIFKTEGILDPIDNRLPYAHPINNLDSTPLRIELFDGENNLVAANVTYIPRGVTQFNFRVDGFGGYWGNPRILWTNFYDTTDASRQKDGGIGEGEYLMRITIPGYHQSQLFRIIVESGDPPKYPVVSIVHSLERLGYLHGEILWIDWCGGALPLSWASITAYSTDGFREVYTFSMDGVYEMWLPAGSYDFGLYHPGLGSKYFKAGLAVSWGSVNSISFIYD